MNCSVCQSVLRPVEKVTNCILQHPQCFPSYQEQPRADISLFQCYGCGHYAIEPLPLEEIYEDYEMDAFQASNPATAAKLADKIAHLASLAPDTSSLLEIGCGNGHALRLARSKFASGTGVDPSAPPDPKDDPSLCFLRDYFDASTPVPQDFSAFMSHQVFEHLENPLETLQAVYNVLQPGGVGLINVPDGGKIMEEKLYHQILAEHVQYYTPFSLASLARLAGFEILEIRRDPEAIELDIYLKKPDPRGGGRGMEAQKQADQRALSQALHEAKSIVLWGAGIKAHTYLPLLTPETRAKVVRFVDSCEDKWGKYISGIPIPIEENSQKALEGSDAVLILASSYNQEILSQLKTQFHYPGKIVYFEKGQVFCLS